MSLALRNRGIVKEGLVACYAPIRQRNLLKWSEDFSNWTTRSSGVIATTNQDVAPNGMQNACLVDFPLINDYMGKPVAIPANTYTCSLWVKSMSGEVSFQLDLTQSGQDHFSPTFTATTEWQRFVFTTTITAISANFFILNRESDNTQLLIFGGAVELGNAATTYQKTTDLQTLWNQKQDNVEAQNIVTNGDFANGTDGWSGTYATNTTSNNTLYNTTSGTQAMGFAQHSPLSAFEVNKKVYIRARFKGNSSMTSTKIRVQSTVDYSWQPTVAALTSNFTNYNTISGIVTYTNNHTKRLMLEHTYPDAVTANGKVMEVQQVLAIDLTALFGAGNEPTQQQCDEMFAGWFDGTKRMNLRLNNGQNGSASGSDTNDAVFSGEGLSFGGDDYVTVPFGIYDEGTIELVYRPTSFFSFNTIYDNGTFLDAWEMWIDTNALLNARVLGGASRVSYTLPAVNTFYHISFVWKKKWS